MSLPRKKAKHIEYDRKRAHCCVMDNWCNCKGKPILEADCLWAGKATDCYYVKLCVCTEDPMPGAVIFVRTCCSKFPSVLMGTKLGTTGNTRPISTQHRKAILAQTWITKSAIKYYFGKTASSTNQKAIMNVILGLSQLFIQMAQWGFNVEKIRKIKHWESNNILWQLTLSPII